MMLCLTILCFLALVALHWCLHQRSIDDLAATRLIALRQQLLLSFIKQLCSQSCLCQAIPKQPDRLRIGNRAAVGQSEKLQEATTVQQLVFKRVVGQVVELLQHQNLDHQNRRVRWSATFGARRAG
jgi:hypothetical protein